MATQTLKPISIREQIAGFRRAITPKELGEILHVSQQTINRYVNQNGMPCLRIGGSVRFDPRDTLAWIDGQ